MPKVSIVIPVHNGEKTISRALQSIAKQTYRNFETILVDNNCTDNTLKVAEEWAEEANITVINCATQGIVPALNTGIYSSKSEYIARQDADDYWYEDKLEKQVLFLENNPEISILGTQIRLLNESGDPQELGTYGKPVIYPEGDQEIRLMMLLGQNPLCHPSIIMKKEVPLVVGGYSRFFHLAEDLHLWIRAFPFFKFANLPDVLVDYTQTYNEEYNRRVPEVLSKMYWELYQTAGLVAGDRPKLSHEQE